MSFRTKLLFVVLFTIFASVSVVAYAVTHYTQAAFEAMDAERTEALVAQFKKEFVQRGAEIAQQAKNIAEANFTERMAIDMSRPNADLSLYVRDAIGSAQEHGLDYVEFVNYDGVLISSAQFPARVGYKNDWLTAVKDWNETTAFLKKEELADGVALSLSVVRTNNTVADKSLYIIGGHRLDKNFLASLVLPTGMRALIYTNLEPAFVPASLFGEKIDAEQLLVSFWVSARITKPVEELAEGAREVASGRWDTRIDVHGRDEIGQLAEAFNHMTQTLAAQKERLVQTERVAAWRELARRLAHELRNPLFPMQITVENLQKARQLDAKQFLEVFNESTATLKTELANLNTIVGRFSDFSKMPAPQFVRVNVNEALRNAVRLFEPQFNEVGKPTITPELFLTEPLPDIDADPDLLHRAFQNLVLNALDAMPTGGALTLRTSEQNGNVRIEVADTGKGLTPEECSRLFTPYYTTKLQGTGLGLAIVQSVVSDHRGTISVTSDEGRGTTFRIDLPQRQAGRTAAPREPAQDTKSTPSTLAAASD